MNLPTGTDFPCGLMVTDSEKRILFVNGYFQKHLNYEEPLLGLSLDSIFTKASLILFESYLYPQLLIDGKVEELQASIFDGAKRRLPVVINAEIYDASSITWSVFIASNRDTLYEELLLTREKLESHVMQLKLMAVTDDLTGLLNRKEAVSRIKKMFQSCHRQKKVLSIILFDIDFFKVFNDRYGHTIGDQVITAVADVLMSEARSTDVVARWGGEEFLVALFDSSSTSTFDFNSRIKLKLSQLSVCEGAITVSSGIIEYTPDDKKIDLSDIKAILDSMIVKADLALYEAKRTGRNKAVIYKNSANNHNG